jgi:probable phosphoglycerate mutase
MLFYFVRHGETDANRQEILAGSGIDYPLNENGHLQAQALAKVIRQQIGQPVHRVLVSDMIRAKQTASYIATSLELKVEIIPDIREWHLGEWEGKPFSEYGHLILSDGEPQSGEARKVFYDRVDKAWRGFHSQSQPYVMVSHGAVWLAMQDLLHMPRFKIDNCQLIKVSSHAGRWKGEVLR